MKAWRLKGESSLKLETLEPVAPESNTVKLKVNYAALSKIDVLLYKGELQAPKLPITIGRQAVGMITEVGTSVKHLSRGDRVVLDSYIACGECDKCNDSHYTGCSELNIYGVHKNGFMSDFVLINENDVFKLPDRVKDEEAIFVSHIAFACNILDKLDIEKGEHLVIVGASVVGVILAQLALYHQAIPILVDTRQDRLAMAEKLGVYYCINSIKDDTKKKIFSLTGGTMASNIAYFPSSDTPIARVLDYAAGGGRVCVADWSGSTAQVSGSLNAVLAKQLTILGVSNGAKLIPTAINMLANKTVSVFSAITGIIDFADVGEALQEQIKHPDKNIKVLVKV